VNAPVRLIAIILLVSSFNESFTQQTACVDSSTVFLLQAENSKISIYRSIVLADSGVFIAGILRESSLSDTSLFIARLDKFNNVLISKKLLGIKGVPWKIIQCNNDDIVLAVMEYTASGILVPHLFRFTINGNIIWQKWLQENITLPPLNGVRTFEITEASDNNFYVGLTTDIDRDYPQSMTTSYYYVYKISSAGSIIWKTTLIQDNSIAGFITAIKVINNEVFIVTQQYYTGVTFCTSTNFKSIGLVKLNPATGAFNSVKYYCLNVFGTGCLSAWDSYRNSVQFLPDDKILMTGHLSTCNGVSLFTIKTDYNFSNPQCYWYDYTVPYAVSSGSAAANQFEEVSFFTRGFNGLNFLYATILPNGIVPMQRKIEMPPNVILSGGSFSPVFKRQDDFLFFVNQKENNQESLRVVEFKGYNSDMHDCTGKDTSFITSRPHTIVPISFSFDTIRYENPLSYNTNFVLQDFSFQRQEICSSISICDSLKIIGHDTICLSDAVKQFTVYRNPGCLKLPHWKIDTSAIQSMQTINDTTVSITFKKPWQGYLYAYSSSCNRLNDSLYIKVIPSPTPVQLGRDTTYCSAVVLDAGDYFANYKWQDGSSGRYYTVDSAGLYYVEARDFCGNIYADTIKFSIPQRSLFIGNDTCVLQFPFLITANAGFTNYYWQNGTNYSQYNATMPGLYYVNAKNDCNDTYSDSIIIYQVIRPFSLGKDTTLCGQEQIVVSAPQGFTEYLWQDNSTNNTIIVSDTGRFFVRIFDHCGNSFSDTIRVNPLNLYLLTGKDTVTICEAESVKLTATPGFTKYTWHPDYNINNANSREVWVRPAISTNYIVYAEKNPGCTVIDSVFVLVKDCPMNFYVPSAFTPNNDGLNDVMGPIATAPLQLYEFRIYNRWGQQIFYSNDIRKRWDGKLNGVLQNGGTFVWRCTYKFFGGSELSQKGSFVLIR